MTAFKKREALIKQVGEDNAYLAFVVALYLEEPDVDALAGQALTDGSNDRKIDLIYLDKDSRKLLFAQGFYAQKQRDSAPANKASDLNTAAAWLLAGDLALIPEKLRSTIVECRAALQNDEIDSVELLYVHNLPESVNVARELQTAESHLSKALGNDNIVVRSLELGAPRVQQLFSARDSNIEVMESIDMPTGAFFTEKGPSWSARVTSIPGSWIHSLYLKYGDRLYSANYRGFLGANRRKRVNSGMKDSAEQRSKDFWAFNNGITILTTSIAESKDKTQLNLSGISIINGAQTSGTLGSVDVVKFPLGDLRVLCRVIECSDQDTVDLIIQYNNTQNAITNWDQFSNDVDQRRIGDEFTELGFSYNRKRGFSGDGDQIGIEQVIQPLLAFHGRGLDAVRGKNQLFQQKILYANAFEEKKARHILFVYALSRAIDNRRLELKDKSNQGKLIAAEERQLNLLRNLNFKPFLINVIANSLNAVIGVPVDPVTVGFQPKIAKDSSLVELTARWAPVVDTFMPLVTAVADAETFYKRMSDPAFMPEIARQLDALLLASGAGAKHADFAAMVSDT